PSHPYRPHGAVTASCRRGLTMLLINSRIEGKALKTAGLICHISYKYNKVAIVDLSENVHRGHCFKKATAYDINWVSDQIDQEKLTLAKEQFHEFLEDPELLLFKDTCSEKKTEKNKEMLHRLLEKRDHNYCLIEPIVGDEYYLEKYLYTRDIRSKILEIVDSAGCTEKHIYSLIGRFL